MLLFAILFSEERSPRVRSNCSFTIHRRCEGAEAETLHFRTKFAAVKLSLAGQPRAPGIDLLLAILALDHAIRPPYMEDGTREPLCSSKGQGAKEGEAAEGTSAAAPKR